MDFPKVLKRDENRCGRCTRALGFLKHEPHETWGFSGKLCKDCFNLVKEGIYEYDVEYVEGYSKIPHKQDGQLFLYLFDNVNKIFFRHKDSILVRLDSNSITSCEIVERKEESMSRQILTAGLSKSKDKKYLRIRFIENAQEEYLLLDMDHSNMSAIHKTINSFIKHIQPSQPSPLHPLENNPTELQVSSEDSTDVEYRELEPTSVELYTYCHKCNSKNDFEAVFCSHCGNRLTESSQHDSPNTVDLKFENYDYNKERVFFSDKGEIVVKKTEHRGAGRKVASWLVAGPIGYVLIGKDKTKKSKAKGSLIVTNKALYCASNVYPYDQLAAITKQKHSILLLLDKDINGNRFSVTLEVNSKNNKKLMDALETARTSHLYFQK